MDAKVTDERQIVRDIKRTKYWHHDIQYIEGEYVEVVVRKYQEREKIEKEIADSEKDAGELREKGKANELKKLEQKLATLRDEKAKVVDESSDQLIQKIIDNYGIFKKRWAKAFAPFLDDDTEDGEHMHDSIIWKSARQFDSSKIRKPNGKAFNAYLVSALMNQLKNLRNARMSHKNHPRVKCPGCGEEVYQIDEKHLAHTMDLDRYRRKYPNYPIASYDGKTLCPITSTPMSTITLQHINRLLGRYTVDDFWIEFKELKPKGPLNCPVTGTQIKSLNDEYFSGLMGGYNEDDFVKDFPDFAGIFTCPFTLKKMMRMTQAHLDAELSQDHAYKRYDEKEFEREYPNVTMHARQVPVVNPYTGKKVDEITPQMLAEAGTNVQEHLAKHGTIELDKQYADLIICPFTGRRTYCIKRSDLEAIGRTSMEFRLATCQYPLRKFQIRCADCGEWVDNVWAHLAQKPHRYAPQMSLDEFRTSYGEGATKVVVTNNSYVEGDSGDAIHISDLFATSGSLASEVEVEDSLLGVAADDLDKKIAHAVRQSQTLEDVCFLACEKRRVNLGFQFAQGMVKEARATAKAAIGTVDFDFVAMPSDGERQIEILVPSRQTIRDRLKAMVDASDLGPAKAV